MFLSCKSHNPYEKTDVTLEKAEPEDIACKIWNLYLYIIVTKLHSTSDTWSKGSGFKSQLFMPLMAWKRKHPDRKVLCCGRQGRLKIPDTAKIDIKTNKSTNKPVSRCSTERQTRQNNMPLIFWFWVTESTQYLYPPILDKVMPIL